MGFAISELAFGGDTDYAPSAAAAEKKRQAAITQGTASIDKAFSGFDDDFYNQRAKAYQDFALPQLSQQYHNTRNQILFNLANRGLLRSGTANAQWSKLQDTTNQSKQEIVDQGISQAQQLRRQVEGQKENLLNQLYQSADPASAARNATAQAASFTAPSTFAPLANMFGSIAQQYYDSQLINRNQAPSYIQQPNNDYNSPGAAVVGHY